ncbi:glutathione S-transferase family protein [Loktanella sp. IMCC34160]|uniref:glutathione S-transferase family protein n=1 Tax=Loktanella sp. IMCC34160 TaxID=2510646 RepID=UPI00101D4660|nr:glutathione S-transferase family protein [Loktanella sp. IMCC34160]RYG93213.1 glutathione S-transferase family protein [Loktanella sp. IMCC34160]
MIRLHHCHQTRSMRVLWLLNELEADFELMVYPFDKTLRSDAYLSLSPAGRVPAIEVDGEVMFESLAILEYLTERFPDAGLGRAPGDLDRADFLNWLHFAETISQHCAALTQQHIMLYEDHMRSPLIMSLESRRLANCLKALEGRLSTPVENRDYVLTSGFSAADIALGQAVYMARHFVRLDPFPEVAKWYDRITDRPAFRASIPDGDVPLLYEQDFYPPWEVTGG